MLARPGVEKLNVGLELEFSKLKFQNQSNLLISLTRILFTKKISKFSLNSKFCLYGERERTTERGRVRKAPREKEKYPRLAIVRSLARLRQSE